MIKKEGPCRNRGRLPKLTAYEKFLFLNFDLYQTNTMPKESATGLSNIKLF
jgi:hypothetical protein